MKFLLLSALCLTSAFGSALVSKGKPSARIIGGEEAAIGQFPFAAAITVETENGHHFCGGTLLNTQWVLTSAFSVHGGTHFDIVLGTTNLKDHGPNAVHLSATEYHTHPLFNPSVVRNDIGLIKFHLPIQETDYVKPIDNLAASLLPDSANLVTFGWGQINDNEPAPVDKLRYVALTSISNSECQHYYGTAINQEMVCVAGNSNEGTCIGDMGAPLLQNVGGTRFVHVGLASFLSGNGCEGTDPSGFTRTFHYRSWILEMTALL